MHSYDLVCMHAYMHACTNEFVCMHACKSTDVCKPTYVDVQMHMCMHVCVGV